MRSLRISTSNGKKLALLALPFCLLISSVVLWQQCHWVRREGAISSGHRLEGFLRQANLIEQEFPRGPEARWSFDGASGQKIALTAESYECDLYLVLLDPQSHQIAQADNNIAFFNPRIETLLPMTGRYTAIVRGTNAEQFGTYWLSLEEGDSKIDWSRSAAESYYSRGIEWSKHSDNRKAMSWMSLGIASYLAQRGQWDEAEKYYLQSLDYAEKSQFVYGQWAVALGRGRLFARRRHYQEAVTQFRLSLDLSQNLRSRHETETLSEIEFGNLYHSIARKDLAKVYFRNATAKAEKYALPSTLVTLYASLNEYYQLKDQEQAALYADKAFSLLGGLDPALELRTIYARAGTYLFMEPRQFDEGLKIAGQMLEKARWAGCVDEEVSALTLMSMAKYAKSDFEAMIDLARKTFDLIDSEDENPNARRIALQLQADGEMARGNHQQALEVCLKALLSVESAWAKETIEELRQELLTQSRAICTQIIMNLYALNARSPSAEYARQAFDYAERSRSRSLLEQLFRGESSRGLISDSKVLLQDQELLERLSAVRGQLLLLKSSSYVSRETLYRLQEERANLVAERLRLRAEIRDLVESGYHAAHLLPIDAAQVQKKLAKQYPKSAILYYQLGVQESFLIALTRDRCEFFKLSNRTIISKAVSEWRALISSQQNSPQSAGQMSPAYNEVAHRLYDALIQPAANLISGRDLIIVPSGALSELAFEALVVDKPSQSGSTSHPRYLVEQHAISYTPSISVLAEIESRSQQTVSGNQILLLGDASNDPSQEGASPTRAGSASAAAPLPAARQEVLRIAKLAEQRGLKSTIWLGPEAGEGKFTTTDLSGFRFIHIATHGISDHQEGEASALTLSPDKSGGQDGILTSDEAAKLRLNCDLIALSGCETSIGQEAGAEGTIGFNRTFLIAGARSICGSLWPVEDSWTEKLMTAFYEDMLAKQSNKSQALRYAKLRLLKLGANPSQWAPFILIGSFR